jgi:hypothetical protein
MAVTADIWYLLMVAAGRRDRGGAVIVPDGAFCTHCRIGCLSGYFIPAGGLLRLPG